jgi:hypothetical protein
MYKAIRLKKSPSKRVKSEEYWQKAQYQICLQSPLFALVSDCHFIKSSPGTPLRIIKKIITPLVFQRGVVAERCRFICDLREQDIK